MQNKTLDTKEHHIALIAAFTASGDVSQLETTLNQALDQGLTISEIKEVITQMYAYSGFPRSLTGINTFMAVLQSRKAQGIQDAPGKQASPIVSTKDKYTRGKAILETLTGTPDPGKTTGFGAFAPELETYLKEHLFADIFERDVLTYTTRELATIAALISLGGVEPMLQSHMGMGLHVGLSVDQLRQLITLLAPKIGAPKANAATAVLARVTASAKPQ